MSNPGIRVVALSGGVGGAKLALGLQRVLPAGTLAVIVNTGDDFDHLGLSISPDLDTTLYTLSGTSDEERGWGRAGESWQMMAELERLGGPSWFKLGDKDLAVHLERTSRLKAKQSLSAITTDFAARFGVATRIFPMSDDPVRTLIDTQDGLLAFQEYFVRRRCEPIVRGVHIRGGSQAVAPPGTLELLGSSQLEAIVICPSNPYLSIDPILAMPCWRAALQDARVPVVAVSPLIGGAAVKGPTAKIMKELGLGVSPATIARHYAGLIDGLILDQQDTELASHCELPVRLARTLMTTLADREHLAREALDFAGTLRGLTSRGS